MDSWIDAIEAIAPPEGFSGYLARLKADIGEGLHRDGAIHVFGPVARLVEALRERGVDAKLIEKAVREAAA